MKPIYVVTKGDYSDYHICAAFLAEDEARRYAEWVGGEVEEFEDGKTPKSPHWREGMKHYSVYFGENGELESESQYGDTEGAEVEVRVLPFWVGGKPIYDPKRRLCVGCFARDSAHAVKIAADMRAKYLAEQEGI